MFQHLWNLSVQVFPNIVATVVIVPFTFLWHHRVMVRKIVEKIEESGKKTREHVTAEVGNNAEEVGTQPAIAERGDER